MSERLQRADHLKTPQVVPAGAWERELVFDEQDSMPHRSVVYEVPATSL